MNDDTNAAVDYVSAMLATCSFNLMGVGTNGAVDEAAVVAIDAAAAATAAFAAIVDIC